jgi:tetratricopeptide (TPR) repeat protein
LPLKQVNLNKRRCGGDEMMKGNIMKRTLMVASVVIGLGVLAGIAVQSNRQKTAPTPDAESAADPSAFQNRESTETTDPTALQHKQPRSLHAKANADSATAATAARSSETTPASTGAQSAGSPVFRQAIECLVSPQSSFGQRQAALEQLRSAGKLDQAISEVEQRMANDPRSAECPAALGRLYLQKCATIQDIREQGILGMKADQVFEAALNLDPYNWDARFMKAVAMSYWPTQLNKGNDILQHFNILVEQQEAQTPQPHFAQTYAWMGDAYLKYGYPDQARQIWQRGAALFPDNPELRAKLQTQ